VGSLSRRRLGRSFAADSLQRARTGFVPQAHRGRCQTVKSGRRSTVSGGRSPTGWRAVLGFNGGLNVEPGVSVAFDDLVYVLGPNFNIQNHRVLLFINYSIE
jgi:hypothetical protein